MYRDFKTKFIGNLVASAPYLFVIWGVVALVPSVSVWGAVVLVIGTRFVIGLVETLGLVFSWHVYGREKAVMDFVAVLHHNKFPARYDKSDDFLNYLARIEADDSLDPHVRHSAREMGSLLGMYESMGILQGARMHNVSELALEAYSPRSSAPDPDATGIAATPAAD
jgi:hypothetical protein